MLLIEIMRKAALGALVASVLCTATPAGAEAGTGTGTGVDPEALATLKQMTDHLGGLQRFSVHGHGTLEVVLVSGQKLQFDNDLTLLVERPNRLLATRRGEIAEQRFVYDGKSLTFLNPEGGGFYATVAAPATLEAMLDFARDELDLVAPAADLLYADAYEALTSDMTAGFVVSRKAMLGDEACTHVAFRKPGVDIQLWISNAPDHLPRKYVLTTTDMAADPQFILTLSDWDPAPKTDAKSFEFVAPKGATRVDFLPAAAH